jgi:hypothetical protein
MDITKLLTIEKSSSFFFPVDLNVKSKSFFFQNTSLQALKENTFLDNRFFKTDSKVSSLELDKFAHTHLKLANKIGFLFHTSFCCSTLLARLLDFPSYSLALKEPLILRRLSDAELINNSEKLLHETALNLLFRSIPDYFAVLVKPTHVALNIANSMLSCQPRAKALLITSTLQDFLISNIKKSEQTKQKIPELVERFMSASDYHAHLPPQAFSPPTFLCGVSLQWHAQQWIIHELMNGSNGCNIKLLWETDLLNAPTQTLIDCLDWLDWSIPENIVETQISRIATQHAKSSSRPYNANEKKYEDNLLASKYRDDIHVALRWSEQYLAPYLNKL